MPDASADRQSLQPPRRRAFFSGFSCPVSGRLAVAGIFHQRLVAGFIATAELIFFAAAAGALIVAPDLGRIAAYRADAALGAPEIYSDRKSVV